MRYNTDHPKSSRRFMMRQAKKQSDKIGHTSRAKMLRLADIVRTVRIRLEEVKDKQSDKLDR